MLSRAEKPLLFLGSSLDDLRAFPAEARRRAGFELHQVQLGLSPSDWKPMKVVGPGVLEIRIRTQTQYRIFYVAGFVEGVYVLHAFEKKTQRTSRREIAVAKARWGELLAARARRKVKEGGT